MSMSRKNYEAIARIINSQRPHAADWEPEELATLPETICLDRTAEDLASYLSDDNPAFDSRRFLQACGV